MTHALHRRGAGPAPRFRSGQMLAIAMLVLVTWAYTGIVDTVGPYVMPYSWSTAEVSFASDPIAPGQAITVPDLLRERVVAHDCRRLSDQHPVTGQMHGRRMKCTLVYRGMDPITVPGFLATQPGAQQRVSWATEYSSAGHTLFPSAWLPLVFVGDNISYALLALLLVAWVGGWRVYRPGRLFKYRNLAWLAPALVLPLTLPYFAGHMSAFVGNAFSQACSAAEWRPFFLLMPLLVAPVCEEMIFRGWAFEWLRKWFSPNAVLWVSSLAFTLFHPKAIDNGSLEFTVLTFGYYLMTGLYLGLVRIRTGSLLACMVAHFLLNLVVELYLACV
ncbi:CPBP family intramembrane glutamic endopeptidase [Marilutibacter aestuarii]|uniref:CPBP family intramembrane metalloprotease n=1 Tax=Marilutibacter aestuarii TaxID=1706195 RepID=A0A507ZYX3_9GAMM|nr:CPBP family intramembrane glutamic endopeptidase [Lysobacter aestuarii]TQD42936.1 CPBP family intramembrane metalloprotease [Lysobacter aestuarii]